MGDGASGHVLFERRGEAFMPAPIARGPWRGALHGAAVAGLFGLMAEELAAGWPDFMLNRLTLDFMRPAPFAPVRGEVELLRDGGRLKLWQLRLRADGVLVAQALALAQRRADVAVPETAPERPFLSPLQHEMDEADIAGRVRNRVRSAHPNLQSLLELRPLTPWMLSGAATSWLRLPAQIVADVPRSRLVHAIMLADMANGAGHIRFGPGMGTINADITLSLYRHPVSEWLGMRARNTFEPHGAGIIHAEFFDEEGGFGHVLHTVQASAMNGPGATRKG